MAYDPVFVEQWTEYSIGVIVFLLRIYARLATVGWRQFKKDDILILISIVSLIHRPTREGLVSPFETDIGVFVGSLDGCECLSVYP